MVDDEPLTAEKMKEFLDSNRYPLVTDFDQEAANRIFGEQKSAFLLLTDDKDLDEVRTF